MKLKVFTKKDCPNCPPAKKIVKELEDSGITVEYFDTEDIDGLAEGSFYMVMATPSTVLVDDSGKEIDSWRGVAPDADKIKEYFSGGAKTQESDVSGQQSEEKTPTTDNR
jgi:glutaredoxin|tara:strand:- start:76 stop:405 length:330 start_codon:yes stop_codon:yes gene_type:complete